MDYIPDIYNKSVLILGCGNILFGDDGFGPTVCKYLLENYKIPKDVGIEDCGNGVREILFDISLSPQKIKEIVIVDAVDLGRKPGEIFEINPDDLPQTKADDFIMHIFPTSNLLKDIRDQWGIKISIFACQVSYIPQEVKIGLSKPLRDGVKKVAQVLAERFLLVEKV